jgi:hypothetical protein
VEGLPKTPKEWLLAAIWGIFAFAAGFESVVSLVHGEWGPSAAAFVLFLALAGVALMLTFSDRLRQWALGISPNWIVGACMTLLLIIALSPYVEEKRWPFSAWFPAPATSEQIAAELARKLPTPPSGNDIAEAVAAKLPHAPTVDEIADAVLRKVTQQGPEAQIVSYGVDGSDRFHAIVALKNWEKYKDYHGVLVTRTAFADRDRMTDDWIAKSIPYTIDGQILTMIAITNKQMRFVSGVNAVEYDFIVLPSDKAPEQIRMLGDVDKLGGKILAQSYQTIPNNPPPGATPDTTSSVPAK